MKACPACSFRNATEATFCIRCGFGIHNVTADATDPNAVAIPQSILASPSHLAPGTLVDGKYRIARVLGEGGMGVVYVARDIHTEVDVVVKAILPEYSRSPEFRERILAEGRALARIDHPNVVRLNAVVDQAGALYLVMQLIEGSSLDRVIQRHIELGTPLPVAEAVRIFRMILLGVAAAHAEGVIHRDLKPANILVRAKDGVAKVTDFGIAKWEKGPDAGHKQTVGVIGSPSYMAPEQIRGQRDIDKRVDVYSLGMLLFELLVGRVPFEAPSVLELMRLHAEAPVPSMHALRPDVPAYLDQIVMRACAKDRDARFANCEAFLAAIDQSRTAAAPPTPASPARTDPMPAPPFHARETEVAPLSGLPAAGRPPQLRAPPHALPADEAAGFLARTAATRESRRVWPWLLGGGVLLAAGIGGAVLSAGASGPEPDRRNVPAAVPAEDAGVAQAVDSGAPVEADKRAAGPLAPLVGRWTSTTGRDYDAVLTSNGVVEFRIVTPSQHPRQGYLAGEARFVLSASAGAIEQLWVEDHLRPTPPAGLTYDQELSRGSCEGVWSEVKGARLTARFDGLRSLSVDLIQLTTPATAFKTQKRQIVGCSDLSRLPAARIESRLVKAAVTPRPSP
jgi:eukaryotic-like serine/threonine-protein kinase